MVNTETLLGGGGGADLSERNVLTAAAPHFETRDRDDGVQFDGEKSFSLSAKINRITLQFGASGSSDSSSCIAARLH